MNSLPGHVARSRRGRRGIPPLGHDQLEAIRLLTNHDLDSSSPFACLLVGQPTLRRRMKLGVLAALDQRIGLRYAMPPMTFLPTNQTGCDYSVFVGCHAAQANHLSRRSNPLGTIKFPKELKKAIPQRSTRRCRHRPIPTTADGRPTCRSVTVMDRRHCRRGLDLSPVQSDAYDGIQYGEIPERTLPVRYRLVLQPLSIFRNSRFAARIGGPSTEISGSNGRS